MLATKENSHPGFRLPIPASHPGLTLAISNTATGFDAALYENRIGPLCSGYFRDSETGLDYAVNRYHQPGMGRFLTMDQANARPGEPATWNRYAYAGGDPANNVDPSGMYTQAQCEQNPQACQGPPPGAGPWNCAGDYDYYDPNCQTQNCPASFAEEFFGNVNADPSADCQSGMPGAYILAPTPPCPLAGIFGDFTADPNSPTPVHTIFNPTVAGILDAVITQLNIEGIDPVIEDGFRTESEQADRRKKYPNTAAQGLSWHEIGDAIDFQRNSNLAAINIIMIAAGFTAVNGDPGHYQMKIGALTQSAADACTQAHPNGN
jgi:RHS repeat-associated protein